MYVKIVKRSIQLLPPRLSTPAPRVLSTRRAATQRNSIASRVAGASPRLPLGIGASRGSQPTSCLLPAPLYFNFLPAVVVVVVVVNEFADDGATRGSAAWANSFAENINSSSS